jgi:CIC family chloride channel protein
MNPHHPASGSSTTSGLPLAPSLDPALRSAHIQRHDVLISGRTVLISLLSIALALVASLIAEGLSALIGLITNLSYYGRWSTEFSSPAGNTLGYWAIAVPVAGAVIVGIMARFGSQAIRGHGIPEAMEQILFNDSKIPARITLLKPLSAAIAIGTGGPCWRSSSFFSNSGRDRSCRLPWRRLPRRERAFGSAVRRRCFPCRISLNHRSAR